MDILVLKLVAAPLLIGMASLAGRRWGETISGWFIGLPLTSGPGCFFLAVEGGFCRAYATPARPGAGPSSIAAGTIALAVAAAAMQLAAPPLWLLAAIV